MFENIKSKFVRKIIFSSLPDIIQLNLIKYNKKIQKCFNFSLINYKIYSGKYITYETNNKGKIYNAINNKLIYEGELLNGKKNGKGKEYDKDGKLIFEGEYSNGKRIIKGNIGQNEFNDGIINIYDINQYLIYEGEYSQGKKNGKGIEYYKCIDKKIKFEGVYYKGKKWDGFGYDIYNNIIYELNNGNGYIKEYNERGILIFEGEYINGEKKGKGKEYNDKGELKYEGEYLNGKKNGKGKEYNDNGDLSFEGYFLYNHRRNGIGYRYGKIEYKGEYLYDEKWSGKGFDGKKVIYILFDGIILMEI